MQVSSVVAHRNSSIALTVEALVVDDMIFSSDRCRGSLDRPMVLDTPLQAVELSLVLVLELLHVLSIASP